MTLSMEVTLWNKKSVFHFWQQIRFIFKVGLVVSFLLGLLFWGFQSDRFRRCDYSVAANVSCRYILLCPKDQGTIATCFYIDQADGGYQTQGKILRKISETGFQSCGLDSRDIIGNGGGRDLSDKLDCMLGALEKQSALLGQKIVWISRNQELLFQMARKHPALKPDLLLFPITGTNFNATNICELRDFFDCPIILAGTYGTLRINEFSTVPKEKRLNIECCIFQKTNLSPQWESLMILELAERARDMLINNEKSSLPYNLRHKRPQSSYHYFWPFLIFLVGYLIGAALMSVSASERRLMRRSVVYCSTFTIGTLLGTTMSMYYENKSNAPTIANRSLANYTRGLVEWQIKEQDFETYVLAPCLNAKAASEVDLRTELWKFFFPFTQRAQTPIQSASILSLSLREEVEVRPGNISKRSLEDIWRTGVADQDGFQALYILCLRSIGICARADWRGRAEILNNGKWLEAPQPPCLASIP